jgi:predicted metal-dependent hydrolase
MPSRSTEGRSTATAEPHAKPKRVTVDLLPGDYEALREWAHLARMSHSDVFRALLRLLIADERVAKAVRDA